MRTTRTFFARGSKSRSDRRVRRSSYLLGAVGLVLLIACANVSNLFLNRLAVRQKDIVVRLALGAERGQLARDCLAETVVFCATAALVGLGLALLALRGAERVFVNQLQTPQHFALNGWTLAATIGLATLSALLIGLIPALQATRVNLVDVLKDNARGSSGGPKGVRFRSALIVVEVALSSVLLVGSSLLLVSFIRLQATPAGFKARGIGTAFLNPGPPLYPTPERQIAFYYQVLDQLRASPQVKSAATTIALPLSGNGARAVYAVQGRTIPPLAERPIVFTNAASEEYFRMLGIPLRSGRSFESTDRAGVPLVCVINESFAKELFGGENPIGHVLLRGQQADVAIQIVGVVGDVKYARPQRAAATDDVRPAAAVRRAVESTSPCRRTAIRRPCRPCFARHSRRWTARNRSPAFKRWTRASHSRWASSA